MNTFDYYKKKKGKVLQRTIKEPLFLEVKSNE